MPAPAWPVFAGIDFRASRLFDTTDVDEAREVCARVFNPHELRVVGPGQRLRSRMDHIRLGGLSLNRLTWGASVSVDPDRLQDYYLISVPVRGRAGFELDGREVAVDAARPCIVNSAQRFRFTASADFDQIVLRFERAAIDAAWQALAGSAPEQPIVFDPALPAAGAAWGALAPALALLAASARGEFDAAALPHLHARIEDQLLTTLLLCQAHGAPLHRPADARPAYLRRAEAYLLERLREPVTLGEVARACGVARRTLQAAFAEARGMGPMQWLRERRLAAVHAALRRPAGEQRPSVTATALAHGFAHLGDFARAYRQAYGETPRQTAQRAR